MIPIPANEHFRLEAIRMLDLRAGNQLPALDELARLAAQIFDVPIALISVIDETMQNAIASVGLNFNEIPRNGSICAHTLARDEVLVISDTALDDRVHQCDIVAGPPYVRFYAGTPLVLPEGFAIGTFCVMDRRPRPSFGDAAKERLVDLAGAALREITGHSGGLSFTEERDLGPSGQQRGSASGLTEDARFTAFSDLAHDICTGLDEIKQASDALESFPLAAENPRLRTLIEQIQASTSYVHRIAGRTLDLARLRSGAVRLNETIVDVADVVDTAITRGRGLARKHGVALATEPMKLRPKIMADELLLEQMITNLMTNAIIHSDQGASAHFAITSNANGELIMAIGNDRTFLTGEEIRQAFEPFHVMGGKGRARRTAGLGLPITRKLIELHGGSIDLRSSPGAGTEVRLSFPAYRVMTWYSDQETSGPSR